jgi:hypothetical protein
VRIKLGGVKVQGAVSTRPKQINSGTTVYLAVTAGKFASLVHLTRITEIISRIKLISEKQQKFFS